MGKVPNSKPQLKQGDVEKILQAKKVDTKKFPVNVVAVRGYYLDTMGAKGANDRGIFDDAAFTISPTIFSSVNWNVDPSSYRKGSGTGSKKGMASLKPGVWDYKIGAHKGKSPAGNQAGKVTVIRDGVSGDYEDTGYFGINLHWGSANGTSSAGCQTAPPNQWPSFINPLVAELKRYGQKTFKYVLITVEEMNHILTDDHAVPIEEVPPAMEEGLPLNSPMVKIGQGAEVLTGIDVSRYQPGFDFKNAATHGVSFAFIKATEGTSLVDKSFERHRSEAHAANIPVGFYHFFRPTVDPVAQASHFCKALGKIQIGELPPVLDLEAKEGSSKEIAASALAFCEAVEHQLGVRPIIYTGPYYFKDFVGNTAQKSALVKYPLWIAHYGAKSPLTPPPWKKWTFWQYTDKLPLVGHKGGLDGNLFNGSKDDLMKLVKA